MSETIALIKQKLALLKPTLLLVEDESHRHAGHSGARSGGGHYRLKIVSAQFIGQSRLLRHRLVYDTLGELMQTSIHALPITALAPDEV